MGRSRMSEKIHPSSIAFCPQIQNTRLQDQSQNQSQSTGTLKCRHFASDPQCQITKAPEGALSRSLSKRSIITQSGVCRTCWLGLPSRSTVGAKAGGAERDRTDDLLL